MRKAVLERGKTPAMVIGWIVDGKTDSEIVPLLKAAKRGEVSRQAITAFRARHQAEVAALKAKVVEAVDDVTIRDKAERIRRLAAMFERVESELAGGKLRYYTADGDRIDAAAIAQYRGLAADVADELGDRPKTPLIDARTVNVFSDLGSKVAAALEREPE